jgi:glycosyltransferase involved in cell wall biosynthesis
VISVIVPAHNEAASIENSLRAMTTGALPGELEIIVVCNGCDDNTAELARKCPGPVTVIETTIASKSHALNLGDIAATGFPRLYADADVTLPLEAIRRLNAALSDERLLAASPVPKDHFLPGTSWAVRAYYRAWMALPYIQEGLMAAGVYGMNKHGRERFGSFPNVIADDGYVRLQYSSAERVEVKDAIAVVTAPRTLINLIRVKTRSRLGTYQLKNRYPALFQRERVSKRYGRALLSVLSRPSLWAAAGAYLCINWLARLRAKCQLRKLHGYVWERDDSSRSSAGSSSLTSAI